METVRITDAMQPAEAQQGSGISKFIKTELEKIKEGSAVKLADFAKEVMTNCPTVKDRSQAYARISFVLKKTEGFQRLQKDGEKYIGHVKPKAETTSAKK